MTNVIIKDTNTKPRLQPIAEFQHYWKMLPNRAYAINAVDAAISRKSYKITLDPTKLFHKVYTGTTCKLLDREGNLLVVNSRVTNVNITNKHWIYEIDNLELPISGSSKPQHGDKFSKFEGRKQALLDALSKLNFKQSVVNYNELLDVKLFLKQFELNSNVENVSWQFMDLWNAFLHDLCEHKGDTSYISPNTLIGFEEACINYVGLNKDHFKDCLIAALTAVKNADLSFIDTYDVFKVTVRDLMSK